MTAILTEFFIGLYIAATSLAPLLVVLFGPAPRNFPRATVFAFIIGVVLIVMAYFNFSLIR